MVKEFSLPVCSSALVTIDLFGDIYALDLVLDKLVALCQFLLENGLEHDVEWYDPDAVQLRQIHLSGMDDLYVVLNQLLAHPAPKDVYKRQAFGTAQRHSTRIPPPKCAAQSR